MKIVLHHGDCVAVLKSYAEGSVGSVVCDPPYGLEFLGKDWDRLDWTDGGGMASVGLGGRAIPWPSYSGTGAAGTANATCARCGGRMRGANKCSCPSHGEAPDWRVRGVALNTSANADRMRKQQESHRLWLTEAFRVLRPGGTIKAFGGTRTFHRLAAAMSEVGFTGIGLEAWSYGSGFPKSLDIGKAIDKTNGEGDRARRFTAWVRARGITVDVMWPHLLSFARNEATARAMAHHYVTPGSQPRVPTRDLWAILRPLFEPDPIPPWVDELVNRIEAEREIIGVRSGFKAVSGVAYGGDGGWASEEIPITAPATPEAAQWEGWGTALKPAWEPVVVGWKPA